MLQRIATDEAELGMFVVRLDGNWFRHPFWKRKFLLDDPDDLMRLRESAVPSLLIDLERGKGLAQRKKHRGERSLKAAVTSRHLPTRFVQPTSRATQLPDAREFAAAKKLVTKAERIISRVFLKARLGETVNLSDVEPIVDEVFESIVQNQFVLSGLLRCKNTKSEVFRHALCVSALMVALARSMKLAPDEIRQAGLAGMMCDIGVGQMPEPLEPFDGDYRALPFYVLPQHIYFGHDLMSASPATPPEVLRAILDHHERLDGSGYPGGLREGEIGRLARMLAICDEFDYLVTGGWKVPPVDPAQALVQLRERNAEFDQDILARFIESIGVYPIGTYLELESGRIAMVVGLSPFDHHHPTVRVFYSLKLRSMIRQVTIDLSSCYGVDSVVGVAELDGLDIPDHNYLRARLLTSSYRD